MADNLPSLLKEICPDCIQLTHDEWYSKMNEWIDYFNPLVKGH